MPNTLWVTDNLRFGVVVHEQSRSPRVIDVDMSQKNVRYFCDPQFPEGLFQDGDGGTGAGIDENGPVRSEENPTADEMPESLSGLIEVDQKKIITAFVYHDTASLLRHTGAE
jgi:hypothetical protein